MSLAKLSTGGALNAMQKADGNDSLDTFIKQSIQKEPLLSFSRAGDSPVQWIQLLNALDQPDLPGWPLLTSLKVTMQKCEKCSREFCSPVNYRRHIRVHRRSLNVNKEFHKNRYLLAAFWDKLSVEEAREVLSLKDVTLKEVPSSSVIRALASSLRQTGVWSLPQVYVRAGSALLDFIQAKSSRLPVSSLEMFSILDDASENTFLCAGTAESLQKYVFDEETAKHSVKLTNLIACTAFLFEQQLVKAWLAEKDAKALRCQKLLVEEEEASQKRQAELLEKKKQKKLRQKEQKIKVQSVGCNLYMDLSNNTLDQPLLVEVPDPSSPSNSNLNSPNMPVNVASCLESIQFPIENIDGVEAQSDFSNEPTNAENLQIVESQMTNSTVHEHLATSKWQVVKSQKGARIVGQDFQASKAEATWKLTSLKDHRNLNGSKVWTRKFNVGNNDESLKPRLQRELGIQVQENSCEVMIGSISVTLDDPDKLQNACLPIKYSEKLVNPWVHVNPNETGPIDRSSEGNVSDKAQNQTVNDERCLQSCCVDTVHRDGGKQSIIFSDENDKQGGSLYSTMAAKEFLAQRWKEAISGNHVKLVLSSELEPPLPS